MIADFQKQIDRGQFRHRKLILVADLHEKIKHAIQSRIPVEVTVFTNGGRTEQSQPIQVQRLDRLISDISDASRLDAELSRALTETVDVGRLLGVLVEARQASAAKTGPHLRLEMREFGGLVVQGIADRLGQVLRNLIDNAVTFSPPDGIIDLAAWREDSWVVITVSDQGPGIPDGKLSAIFDRFYSERPETEKFGTHSGLGLSISKQIVEAHGGSIQAENRRDGTGKTTGARFVIRLPVD